MAITPDTRPATFAQMLHDLKVEQEIQRSRLAATRFAVMALAVVVGAVIVTLFLAPMAHADDDKFVSDIQAAGFNGTSVVTYLAVGHTICDSLAQGYSKHNIAEVIYAHTKFQDEGDAEQLVNMAQNDLCPGVSS
jgi:hypothetical protein